MEVGFPFIDPPPPLALLLILIFFYLIFTDDCVSFFSFLSGYDVAMDLIEWMQDYCDNERDQARHLIAFADKWTSRLKHQSSLVSYHTSKRAQLDVVRIAKDLARLKQSTCAEIQSVIEKFRVYVNRIYINERFRSGRKHHRTNEFKKLFKTAHASLREITDELATLYAQERKARDALRSADCACEILELDPTTSEKQLARAMDIRTKKRAAVEQLDERIVDTKDKQKAAQKAYRTRATEIFKQCQSAEEERLEQTRETLLDFIQAMHTPKYSSELEQLFQGLTSKITTQQNSFDDLVFWATTYGIGSKLSKSMAFEVNESDDDDDDDEKKVESRPVKKSEQDRGKTSSVVPSPRDRQHANDPDDDEPSAAYSSTPSTKTKRTKIVSPTEKKNVSAVLNRV